jgi:hypothetical protein
MSAEIIRFIARPDRERQPSDFPTIVFRAVPRSGKSATEDSDTAPCEYLPPIDGNS